MFRHRFVNTTLLATLLAVPAAALDLGIDTEFKFDALPGIQQIQKFQGLHGVENKAISSQVSLSSALRALGTVAQSFDNEGYGDVDYWRRSATDWGRAGKALGQAISRVSNDLSDAPLRAALGSAGQQLQRLDHTGYGDVTYWRLRARRFAETVRNAGQQLDSVAASVTPAQTVSLRTALVALAEAAYGMSSQGQGDVGYWRRATRNLALLGAGFGRGIKIIAGETGSPLSAILGSMANQLTRLSYDGYGDVHYWLAKASGVADQIRSQATVLVDTANGID